MSKYNKNYFCNDASCIHLPFENLDFTIANVFCERKQAWRKCDKRYSKFQFDLVFPFLKADDACGIGSQQTQVHLRSLSRVFFPILCETRS